MARRQEPRAWFVLFAILAGFMPRPVIALEDESAPAVLTDEATNQGSWALGEESAPRSELIRERYPNRAVKIERQVIQDSQDNFLNHGKWRMWDQVGNLMAEGQYNNGQRDGTWVRWLRAGDSKLLTTMPFRQFRGPFVSQATFQDGELHGTWTIYDSKQRKVSEWQYEYGERHGKWVRWYANGRKMREANYHRGDIDGQLLEWSPDGAVITQETYEEGRRLAKKVTRYKSGKQKKTEGVYLHARLIRKSDDDWWSARLGKYEQQGNDEKHGAWTTWYESGQIQLRGQYENDLEVGKFTWWHPNGQKAAEGSYELSKQTSEWTWWHKNGLKSIQGEYVAGAPSSRWTWWQDSGKVAQRADFTHSKGRIVDVPAPIKPETTTARRPSLKTPQRRTAR